VPDLASAQDDDFAKIIHGEVPEGSALACALHRLIAEAENPAGSKVVGFQNSI
jgi:hypothetical protein